MEQTNLVSVIILTWNGMKFIENCLKSVSDQTYSQFEIIVVDNASTDDTVDFIQEKFPTVRLVKNEQNLGFAAGVNIGLSRAEGDILFLLNQDTIVEPDWLVELVSGMSADDSIGIGGCKILSWSGDKLWHAGIEIAQPRLSPTHIGEGDDQEEHNQKQEVEAITGAAMGIKRELIEAIGGLDERFFMYFEDVDFCLRAGQAGYKTVYFPKARLKHYVGGSLGQVTYKVLYKYHTSRMLFLFKQRSSEWFCNNFVPAEKEYLTTRLSLNEFLALRRVYTETAIRIAKNEQFYTIDNNKNIIKALTELHKNAMIAISGLKWQVTEFEFKSNLPLIGFIISWFRRLWSSIATKWVERNILQQQNFINHNLLSLQLMIITILDTDLTFLDDMMIESETTGYNKKAKLIVVSKDIKDSFEIKGENIKLAELRKKVAANITKHHTYACEQELDWKEWTQPHSLSEELTYCNFNIIERQKSATQLQLYKTPPNLGRINGFIFWLKKQLHNLVIYYVNLLGKKQIVFNESIAFAITNHQSEVEELKWTVSTLEKRVKNLEARLKDIL